jgi:hypothetical protein
MPDHDPTAPPACLHRHADRSRTTHQRRAQRSPSGGRPAPRGGAWPAPSTELAKPHRKTSQEAAYTHTDHSPAHGQRARKSSRAAEPMHRACPRATAPLSAHRTEHRRLVHVGLRPIVCWDSRFTPSLQRLIHELEKKSQNVQARPNANHDGSHWGALCHTLGARAAMQTGSMQTTGACDSAHDARRARAWRFLSTSSAGAGGNWLVAGAGVRCAAQPGARGGGVDRAGDPEGSRVHTIYRLWSKA